MFKRIVIILIVLSTLTLVSLAQDLTPKLEVSKNNRFLMTENDEPFFWLGDTGWLLFSKLDREEAEKYLEDRKNKGFNVVQVMLLHSLKTVNAYGDSALIHENVTTPRIIPGNFFTSKETYDYWDHVDYIVNLASKKGIYIAMVPIWGSNVRQNKVNVNQSKVYAEFISKRFKNNKNIIWLNGGDIRGCDSQDVWNEIGSTLHEINPNQLITFHPFGRTQSSTWFHNQEWLSFNSFQSGHRDYAQDTENIDLQYGEDNWKYVNVDYNKLPTKPTLDAEPSYEGIPHGLHDTLQLRWTADDLRRYAYWSVFAGGCGFTYGNNSVMQMHKPNDKVSSYGAKDFWFNALNDKGATQMIYLKKLMLSHSYFDRVPDQSLIAKNQGTRYNYLIATRGANFAMVYTYNGRNIPVAMGKIVGEKVNTFWFNPRTGETLKIGIYSNSGTHEFNPPGEVVNGNDWVLVLESKS
jgi:hypothetical protein